MSATGAADVRTRICTRCGYGYPGTLQFFQRDVRMRDGFNSWCRPCRNRYGRERMAALRDKRRGWEDHRLRGEKALARVVIRSAGETWRVNLYSFSAHHRGLLQGLELVRQEQAYHRVKNPLRRLP